MAWEYANTYAPWQVPNGQTGYNPSFGGYGAEGHTQGNTNWLQDPFFKGSFLGLGRKRSSPDFYAPSYQGTLFTPAEGLPDWYTNSDPSDNWKGASYQGLMQNEAEQNSSNANGSLFAPAAPTNDQSFGSSASGISPYSMPNYIGQSPWLGETVNNYAPNYGTYGGYNTYGGYSNSQAKQSSPYQPYVPTGYSNVGQY